MMFFSIIVTVILQTCLNVNGQLAEQNKVVLSSVSRNSKSNVEPVGMRNANSVIQRSNADVTSIGGSKSLRDFIDLSTAINQKVDPNENQLQTIFNLNDITALETAEGEPTLPNIFDHGLNTPADIKTVVYEGNGTDIQVSDSGPHRIPKPAIDTITIPFDINADRTIKQEKMVENKTKIPAETRNILTLQQNSINLSPNQELHKTLPQDSEPHNPQNEESMLLSNNMEALRQQKSHSEPITTGSFGLSLKNRNIAQLLNGLSNDLTPQGKIVRTQKILNNTKPESEVIIVNAVPQINTTSTLQDTVELSPSSNIFKDLPSPLWVPSNQQPMIFAEQEFGPNQQQPNVGETNALVGNKELEQLVNNVVSSVDQNAVQQRPDSATPTAVGQPNLIPNESLNSSLIPIGLNNIPSIFQNIPTGAIAIPRQNWVNPIPWTQRVIANPGQFRVGNLRPNLPSNTRLTPNVINPISLTGNSLPRSRVGTPVENNVVPRGSPILTRPVSRQIPIPSSTRARNNFRNVQLINTRNGNIQRPLPGATRPNAAIVNSRNNVGQRINVIRRNTNSVRQLPTNQNQNIRPILNNPSVQTNARVTRTRGGPRTIPNTRQTNRNTGDHSGPSRQIAAVVLSPEALSNILGQSTSSNENRRILNLLARQNSTTRPAFRNRNVLSRLLQSIDLPKNLPPGRMIMLYPRSNSTVSGTSNTGSNRNIIPSLLSQIQSILNQRRRATSTPQRPSREQLLSAIRQLLQRQQNPNVSTVRQNGLNNQQTNVLQQTESNARGRTSQPSTVRQTQNRIPSSVQRQNIARQPQNTGQQQNIRRVNLPQQRPSPF